MSESIVENHLLLEKEPQTFFQAPKANYSCIVCKKSAKYQCPKCKKHYCELICYKSHSSSCTEQFYKEQVTQHLKNTKASQKEILKMKNLLNKYKNEEQKDDIINEVDETLLDKKIQRFEELKCFLDKGELTIEKLSWEEMKDLEKFANEQKNQWKPWKPYWWNEEFVPSLLLLEENAENNENLNENLSKKQIKLKEKRIKIKKRIDTLPEFSTLYKNKINDELFFHLFNILSGGCFVMRLFNGDLSNNSEDCLDTLINISKCLHIEPRISFGCFDNAIRSVIENSILSEGEIAKNLMVIVCEDMVQILKNKFFIFEILFKIYDLCHDNECFDEKNSENPEKNKNLSKMKHKIIFLMSLLKSKVSTSLLENFQKEMKSFIEKNEKFKEEANELGYYKKLNLLL